MSYNIDTWKTKKLDSLAIPLSAFYAHERKDFHPRTIINIQEGEGGDYSIILEASEGKGIHGLLVDGVVRVETIEIRGEFSGTMYREVLIPALEKSTGELEAVLIWEGGDSVTRLAVKDGHIIDTDIEL